MRERRMTVYGCYFRAVLRSKYESELYYELPIQKVYGLDWIFHGKKS